MLFQAPLLWWDAWGPRPRAHEGIDLCLYRDHGQNAHRLDTRTRIPTMYDGTVVRLCDDLIGRSVMIEHRFADCAGWFYTMYGHTRPCSRLEAGQAVRQGEIVARLAEVTRPGATVLPHLHISVGWAHDMIPAEQLDWDTIPSVLHLLDPLPAIGGAYQVIEQAGACGDLVEAVRGGP